jgi:hypothetical protein
MEQIKFNFLYMLHFQKLSTMCMNVHKTPVLVHWLMFQSEAELQNLSIWKRMYTLQNSSYGMILYTSDGIKYCGHRNKTERKEKCNNLGGGP